MNYQTLIRDIDNTLAKILVNGDNVMYLAYARQGIAELVVALSKDKDVENHAIGQNTSEENE